VFVFRVLEKSISELNCEIRDCVWLEKFVTKLKSPLDSKYLLKFFKHVKKQGLPFE